MIVDTHGSSGCIENFTDFETMTEWKNIFHNEKHFDTATIHQTKELAVHEHGLEDVNYMKDIGSTKGIDKNHKGYLWFKKVILDKIQPYFSKEFHLMYAHFADSKKPLVMHLDYYPERIPEGYQPYVSCLIPYTAEYTVDKVHHAATVICNKPGTMTQQEYDEHLSHNNPICMQEYSIQEVHQWRTGDLIWWDQSAYHGSNNFPLKVSSKQSLVLHTYAR